MSKLFTDAWWAMPVKSLLRWLTATPQISNVDSRIPANTLRKPLPQSMPDAAPHPAQTRPLRVLQVMEVGHSGRQLGRLRISGRMADVCAELDRLAAREAMQL